MRKLAILVFLAAMPAPWARGADDEAPKTPKLKEPDHKAIFRNYPREVTFEWSKVRDRSGVEYYLEVMTYYPSQTNARGVWRPEVIGPLRDTDYEYTHVGDQSCQWRVWTVDGAGNMSPKSVWRSFTFDTLTA